MEYLNTIDHDNGSVSEFLDNAVLRNKEVSKLQHLCRYRIRHHLMKLRTKTNLLCSVPYLHLPRSITNYLLYNIDPYDPKYV